MTILREIIQHKELEVAEAIKCVPMDTLKLNSRPFPMRNFFQAVDQPGLQIIAEIKRRSPSSGDIQPEADPVQIAREYEEAGAAAISILTDEKYFNGNVEHLKRVKEAISIPVLRKDFIISEYQVLESYLAGADAILLIVHILKPKVLIHLYQVATELGLSVLVELNSKEQLKPAQALNPQIVGVNARNLTTMKTDINRCKKIFPFLPHLSLKVAESGISTIHDLQFIQKTGYDAALIGTALMQSSSPGILLRSLLKGVRS